jgi:glycosyltransferase involved in cell wall biosynthesis
MRVCLNMIVKNEAHVIERCLRSVRPCIDSWAIVDTGSSDGTQEIIQTFLHDRPGELVERPWVDFSTNRNEALQLARKHGDYAFFIDADDVLEADSGFGFGTLGASGYAIESLVAGVSSWITALARLDIDWTWHGVLHEVLTASDNSPNTPLYGARIAKFADGARSQLPIREKYTRDAELLRDALAREPGNTRYQFYLAQSLREAGRWSEAIEAYRQRSLAGGSEEEVYFCKLMIAVLGEQIGAAESATVEAYLDAWRYRPQRAETPMRLAHFFLKRGRHAQARDCARAAIALPPTGDHLLVDRTAWGWRSRDDLAIALFHLGDESGCADVYRQMLSDPDFPANERARVLRNLEKLTQSPR